MKDMRGRYPGGPSRREGDALPHPRREKPDLISVEAFESRLVRGSQRVRAQQRRKRLTVGVVFSLLAAIAVGGYIGFSTHRSDSEVAQEIDAQHQRSQGDLEQQMNRLIDEMWKSEALEKAPNIR